MKKINLSIRGMHNGENDASKMQEALTRLSGAVSAEVLPRESKAYAYTGDELDSFIVAEAVQKAGFALSVTGEECLSVASDVRSDSLRGC